MELEWDGCVPVGVREEGGSVHDGVEIAPVNISEVACGVC